MGCAGSKQARRDDRTAASPLPRSYSLPVHHPAQSKHDSYHLVALTSTTLGSLKLDSLDQIPDANLNGDSDHEAPIKKKRNSTSTTLGSLKRDSLDQIPDGNLNGDTDHEASIKKKRNSTSTILTNSNYTPFVSRDLDFSTEVFEAKTWSNMIEDKIPKMPPRTPPQELETINTWELMEGLEDHSPLRVFSSPHTIDRSFSFHTSRDTQTGTCRDQKQPTWLETKPSDSIVTDFDPEIISTFRKALEELSPGDRFLLRSPQGKLSPTGDRFEKTGFVKARVSAFQERINAKKAAAATANKCPPRGEGKVVLYFTSLRGVRKTHEDCCTVRMILKGFGVHVDERDVSLHSGFREELRDILGKSWGSLPRVFVKGKYLGGVEEVRRLHEEGELWKVLEGCEMWDGGAACEGCGDVRFVSCDKCHGSCKVYMEEEEEEEEGQGGGFVRCFECNENGIVRCPICCS